MISIAELWRQVAEAPDDIALRLVLADALIERGEARGELIALQCRGAGASMMVDRSIDSAAERISELIAEGWDDWLGPVAQVLVRQGSTFVDGMLANAQVASPPTPSFDWKTVAGHHELCALRHVKPFNVRPENYATFLAGLPNDPHTVEIRVPHVSSLLRGKREHWRVRCIRYGGIGWWSGPQGGNHRGVLTNDLVDLAAVARDLEVLDVQKIWDSGAELAEVAPRLPRMFPKLAKVKIESGAWLGEHEARLRALGAPFEVE